MPLVKHISVFRSTHCRNIGFRWHHNILVVFGIKKQVVVDVKNAFVNIFQAKKPLWIFVFFFTFTFFFNIKICGIVSHVQTSKKYQGNQYFHSKFKYSFSFPGWIRGLSESYKLNNQIKWKTKLKVKRKLTYFVPWNQSIIIIVKC